MPKKSKSAAAMEVDQSAELEMKQEEQAVNVDNTEKKDKKRKEKKSHADANEDVVEATAEEPAKKEKKSKKRSLAEAEDDSAEAKEPETETPICLPVGDSAAAAAKNKKPLPPGYVCKACGNGGHAIYDCPLKVSKKEPAAAGAGNEAKADTKATKTDKPTPSKGNDSAAPKASAPVPNVNKTYVSGLSFDMTTDKLKAFFEERNCKVKDATLVTFDDNKSKCKGFGFVTFLDADSTTAALALSGFDMGKKTLNVVPCVVKEQEKSPRKNADEPRPKKAKVPKCYRCGENHDPATCSNPRICYRCRASTHLSSQCPMKKK
jgi:hypothetical protein